MPPSIGKKDQKNYHKDHGKDHLDVKPVDARNSCDQQGERSEREAKP